MVLPETNKPIRAPYFCGADDDTTSTQHGMISSFPIPMDYSFNTSPGPQRRLLLAKLRNESAHRWGEMNSENEKWAPIEPSMHAQNTINPIRRIVDVMNVDPNPEKELIKLHIGDPSITGILPTHPKVNEAVLEALMSGKYNGYGPAIGFQNVREELAKFLSDQENKIDADDITLTSGCSHALQLAIEALAGPGKNILVPRPGFPLYATLMRPHEIEDRYYNLRMEENWEADLEHMESLIDDRTAAIVVNNPNNPTGAVYSREHLEDILKLAEKYRIPIIADEIYGDMVFGGAKFFPMHTLAPKVPMLTCDGISKRYLVPGWRLGWLIVHDVDDAMRKVRMAVRQLAQKIVGPCALMQGALIGILNNTPAEFFQRTRDILSENVDIVCRELSSVPGIQPVRAQGAMYMMIGVDIRSFPEFDSEESLIKNLITEESLYCLPGTAFFYPGTIRFVMTHSARTIIDACDRLKSFCRRHYREINFGKKSMDQSMMVNRRRHFSTDQSMSDKENGKIGSRNFQSMSKSLLSGAHLLKKSITPNSNGKQNDHENSISNLNSNFNLAVSAQ